jgi:hypothetical protein
MILARQFDLKQAKMIHDVVFSQHPSLTAPLFHVFGCDFRIFGKRFRLFQIIH